MQGVGCYSESIPSGASDGLSISVVLLSTVNSFLLIPGVNVNNGPTCKGHGSIHCFPGQDCWPDNSKISQFKDTLDGKVYLPTDDRYANITIMKNLRVTKYPAMIAVVESIEDVQKCVKWARSNSIRIVVQSSGHDYQGRSTADGALMIYLGGMKDIDINLNSTRSDCPYGEITLESGMPWAEVYMELDKVNRVMIGGSAHTVAIGGYTLGGGHSPISRMYGLAVDNLLEVEMVTANATVVVANDNGTKTTDANGKVTHSTNTDLFWALRGGGGGTFGVATKFKFRLHKAPDKMVTFSCNFVMYHYGATVAGDVLEELGKTIVGAPKQWGGYWFMSILPFQFTQDIGTISVSFNHFGGWDSPTRSYMDRLMNFRKDLQRSCSYQNRTSFWDYEKGAKDPLYYRNSIAGVLLQKESFNNSAFADFLIRTITYPKKGSITGLTGTLLGGSTMDASTTATSVHPGFRTALTSLTIGTTWDGDGSTDDDFAQFTQTFGQTLKTFGDGMYPNESTGKTPTWKSDFWGSNYDRLALIKKAWDPNNVFMCNQCVGWDEWQS